jgi:D-tyrosyl-tRNA(Tyr) deacylase
MVEADVEGRSRVVAQARPRWENVPVRVVVQRVTRASVAVDGEVVGAIAGGLLVLLGVATDDTAEDADRLAGKVARLRILESSDGKVDLSVLDTGGEILVVSQFTLLADTTKGNRPGFSGAARPEVAKPLVERFCAALAGHGLAVATGVFGARMNVELVNDGPVTIVLG